MKRKSWREKDRVEPGFNQRINTAVRWKKTLRKKRRSPPKYKRNRRVTVIITSGSSL